MRPRLGRLFPGVPNNVKIYVTDRSDRRIRTERLQYWLETAKRYPLLADSDIGPSNTSSQEANRLSGRPRTLYPRSRDRRAELSTPALFRELKQGPALIRSDRFAEIVPLSRPAMVGFEKSQLLKRFYPFTYYP
jgi:hypothetical protein